MGSTNNDRKRQTEIPTDTMHSGNLRYSAYCPLWAVYTHRKITLLFRPVHMVRSSPPPLPYTARFSAFTEERFPVLLLLLLPRLPPLLLLLLLLLPLLLLLLRLLLLLLPLRLLSLARPIPIPWSSLNLNPQPSAGFLSHCHPNPQPPNPSATIQ